MKEIKIKGGSRKDTKSAKKIKVKSVLWEVQDQRRLKQSSQRTQRKNKEDQGQERFLDRARAGSRSRARAFCGKCKIKGVLWEGQGQVLGQGQVQDQIIGGWYECDGSCGGVGGGGGDVLDGHPGERTAGMKAAPVKNEKERVAMEQDENVYYTYYRYLIPLEALERVRGAAPNPLRSTQTSALPVLRALTRLSVPLNSHHSVDGTVYYQVHLHDLVREYERMLGMAASSVSSKSLGGVLRGLGLTCNRKKDGYVTLWTLAQLKIIREVFKEEGGHGSDAE